MPRDGRSKKSKKARPPGPERGPSPAGGPASGIFTRPQGDPLAGGPRVVPSAYEASQIRLVAAWKAEHPRKRSGLLGKAAAAVAHQAERYIPAHVAKQAIDKVYDEAEHTANRGDIERHAGVASLGELKHRRMEECDQLTHGVVAWAEGLAVAGGAATGAGGFLTSALDVPLLLTLTLRTILRVGHCYGYALDQPRDRRTVLGVLMVAATDDPEKKRTLLAKMREIEDWMLEQVEEEVIEDEALELLLQIEIFDDIPGLGAITGGLGNYVFLHHAANASRRVFQEWWLRDGGKVGIIAPAPLDASTALDLWRPGLVSRAVYGGFYCLGFGVTLPVWLVASRLKGVDNALTRGVGDGAAAATDEADAALARLRNLASPGLDRQAALAPA